MIPPIEFQKEIKEFIQYVSHHQASREDVINLQKELDRRLLDRQAKDHGICPIREQLHQQCFDEILRQVTIDCPERGLLLMRVRDEIKMTIAAYQTLYKTSVAFGMRKQIEAQENKNELREELGKLKLEKENLESKRNQLHEKKFALESDIQEKKNFERNQRKQEIEFLEYQNNHLRQFYQSLESSK